MDRGSKWHTLVKNEYKMQTTYLLVVFAIVVQQTTAGTFPEFINKCKISDPKFDDCVLKSANDLLPTIINGDEKYGIPPLPISNLTRTYNFTETFGMKFTNLTVHPNGGLVIRDIHFDFQKQLLTFSAQTSRLVLTANYTTVGKCPGNLHSEGGVVTMTFDDVEFVGSMPLQFKTVEDKKYLEAVSCKLLVNGTNFRFQPSLRWQAQIQPGEWTSEHEKEYQAHINKIPEHMKAETEQLNEGVVEALNKIFELLPFEELFKP